MCFFANNIFVEITETEPCIFAHSRIFELDYERSFCVCSSHILQPCVSARCPNLLGKQRLGDARRLIQHVQPLPATHAKQAKSHQANSFFIVSLATNFMCEVHINFKTYQLCCCVYRSPQRVDGHSPAPRPDGTSGHGVDFLPVNILHHQPQHTQSRPLGGRVGKSPSDSAVRDALEPPQNSRMGRQVQSSKNHSFNAARPAWSSESSDDLPSLATMLN